MDTATKKSESSHISNNSSVKSGVNNKHWSEAEVDSNFTPSFFQSKPQIGRIDDPSEMEADRAALDLSQSIYSGGKGDFFPAASPGPGGIRGKSDQSPGFIQQKPAFESSMEYDPNSVEQSTIQKSSSDVGGSGKPVSADNLSSGLENSRNSGHSLPDQTRQDMEEGFDADFSNVKVHTGSDAVQMSKDLNAQAFTSGSDVYFNEGKYNPGTREGDHLLAHELTHTIQQGAVETGRGPVQTKANDENLVQRQEKPESQPGQGPDTVSLTPVDISTAFKPNPAMAAYLDDNRRKRYVEVPVKMGKLASGHIKVRQSRKAKEGTEAKYLIYKGQGLPFTGVDFLNPLRSEKIEPVIALSTSDPNNITGFVSLRIGKNVLQNPKSLIREINKHLELLGLFGIKPLNVPAYENKVANGVLTLRTSELKTSVAGFLDASGSFGLVGEKFTFELNTHVDLKGLAQGDFKIERKENGQFEGEGEIAVGIKNVTGKVKATYVAGDVSILGTVGIESEKFSGSVTIMVADRAKAKQTMMAELGVETLEEEKKKSPSPKSSKKKTKKNQVVIGWGTVTARITPWLEGSAKVGMDEKGQVTIVGEIVVPKEVELMEQKGKKATLFELEIKAGYGIPLVGQVGLFASIGMFVSAGFGPLVLSNVGFEGTYSTDPSVLQTFIITGTLGISAFAIIGLEAKAGVFITLIGHDIKAGIKVTAAAGIKAYAEVTPTFEYLEKANPEGGKVGEAWLKGHFEAAAQLFLQLAGDFFVEIDAPWWSPVPDKTWEYPLGDVEYPLGPSMGIGGDVAWLVGSPEVPELKFSPVDFDPDKFTSDIMADPPPGKGGGKAGKQKGEGKWEDKSQKGGKEEQPDIKKGKGLEGKKKQDFTKLPEQQRYMRALGELGDLGDSAKNHPITFSVLAAKVKNVKRKYALQQISIKDKEDSSASVFVKQGKYNNGKKLIEIKLMSEAERQKLVHAAIKELESRQAGKADPKAQTITEADAKVIAAEIAARHPVVESIGVIDGKETWDYEIDLGDKKEMKKGLLKAPQEGGGQDDILFEKKESFPDKKGETHNIYFKNVNGRIEIIVSSVPQSILDFITFYEEYNNIQDGSVKDDLIKRIRILINGRINDLIADLKKAKNANEEAKINQDLLNENVELSKMLEKLLSRDRKIGTLIESYALEGLTGTYASIPKPPWDALTGDHQPQASILIWCAEDSHFFDPGSNMAKKASGTHANNGMVINLHEIRHAEGRTFQNKAKTTKKEFIEFVQKEIKQKEQGNSNVTDQDRRDIVVDRIKLELELDVPEMRKVIKKKENWEDINDLELDLDERKALKKKIKSNIEQGEDQIASQDIEGLKR